PPALDRRDSLVSRRATRDPLVLAGSTGHHRRDVTHVRDRRAAEGGPAAARRRMARRESARAGAWQDRARHAGRAGLFGQRRHVRQVHVRERRRDRDRARRAVAATKTYTATCVALALLAAATAEARGRSALSLAGLPEAVDEAVAMSSDAARLARRIGRADAIVVLGRGYQFAAALEASLKI